MTQGSEFGARLREAFAALDDLPAEGRDCPVTEHILDSVDEKLTPEENREVVRHMAACGACSAAWGLARELSEEPQAGATVVHSELSAGLHRRWMPLAAAAVLIVALGLVAYQLFMPGETPSEPVYRVEEESWLTSELPTEVLLPREDCVLSWAAGPEGTSYDVVVTDEDLETLAEAFRLSAPELRIDAEVLAGVPPGGSILWRVTAYLPDGRQARSRTFVTPLEPPR